MSRSRLFSWLQCLAACALQALMAVVPVQAREALPEQVLMIRKPGLFGLELEATLFRPPGPGPFPLVVINHGKEVGDPRLQRRASYPLAARFFLARGYVVAVPMRQGFAGSTGSYIGGGCNVESNGLQQAEDVKATIDHLLAQPGIDAQKLLVVGQSHGGLTTMAFGTLSYPGVKGLINFAGGLRQETCPGWEATLARAFGAYGANTRVSSLWFYGDNDSFWSRPVWEDMHGRYVRALATAAPQASARMVAFGTFEVDAHRLFSHRAGAAIWQPEVERFLREQGLPHEVRFPAYLSAPAPVASGFSELARIEAVPFLKDSGRKGYQTFLSRPLPRAFALSPTGAWGFAHEGDDPQARALGFCNAHAPQRDCRLYAVDETVVWKPD